MFQYSKTAAMLMLSSLIACADVASDSMEGVDDYGAKNLGALATQYEAERYSRRSGSSVRSNHAGFTGDGFMDYGGRGSWVQWDIEAATSGRYMLEFRYANASSRARVSRVIVNGESAGKLQFERAGRNWSRWAVESLTVELAAGRNKVRLRAITSAGGPNLDHVVVTSVDVPPPDRRAPRGLYTYDFGGLEALSVEQSVGLLREHGYAGIAVEVHAADRLGRLRDYQHSSETHGDSFQVVAAFVSHKFHRHGWSDAIQRAAIDQLAGREGKLWIWFHDRDGISDPDRVESLVRGIVEYGASKGVETVLYPHHGTLHPTTLDALRLVEEIDQESLTVAINFTHELLADREHLMEETFERAGPHLSTVTLAGASDASAILSLHESEYPLAPFASLVATSGFDGPVGFLNHKLSNPADYLQHSAAHWNTLCEEVGLHD